MRLLLLIACVLAAGPLSEREVTDAVGRKVTVSERVMAAGPSATVLLYVLAPEKMTGWPNAPRLEERPYGVGRSRIPCTRMERSDNERIASGE